MTKHKLKAKLLSNIIKLGIVFYIFYEYHRLSSIIKSPLTSDSCKGLLFIAISGFLILLPVDGSIFIKNFFNARNNIQNNNDDTKEEYK